MSKEMLINSVDGQECRIAIVEDGKLEELYIERASSASHVGNIYKGRVTNVESAIQAAFVDFGLGKNGFLHISDVNPRYFPRGGKHGEAVGQKKAHHERPPIQECLRRGQEVVVQLTKEGIGTKGPTLTTYLSIPGRLLVMMPGMSRLGVSRKIDDEEARNKARDILEGLKPPEDVGFIVRTAGIDRPKRDFQRDMNYLTWLWKNISHKIKNSRPPCEIYQESDLVIRTIRDVYNADIGKIICDNELVAHKVKDFLHMVMPRTRNAIELYTGKVGLFEEYGLEAEMEKIYNRRVEMECGGSLVIDQAEALVAIDVNSGRFREHTDAETTATRMNQEAAREIARQLRLRDLGGVIVIDFIDMREDRNRRAVEKTLREAMGDDRAKTKVLRMSAFCIVEMTRQRVRPSLKQSLYRTCHRCEGAGLVKSEESVSLGVIRNLQRAMHVDDVATVEVTVSTAVESYLANQNRKQIAAMEEQTGKTIVVKSDPLLSADQIRINCMNSRGSTIAWEKIQPHHRKDKLSTISLEEHESRYGRAEPPAGSGEEFPPEMEEGEEEVPPIGEAPAEQPAPLGEQPAAEAEHPASQPESAGEPHEPRPDQPSQPQAPGPQGPEGQGQRKRRRRGRRGGRRHRRNKGGGQQGNPPQGQQSAPSGGDSNPSPPQDYHPPEAHGDQSEGGTSIEEMW